MQPVSYCYIYNCFIFDSMDVPLSLFFNVLRSTGCISDLQCQVWLQRDQNREDCKGDTEDPTGGIDRDFTETLNQFGKLIT